MSMRILLFSRIKSFRHAIDGLFYTIKHHKNFSIHLLLALVAIGVSFILNLSALELAIIFLIIFFGLVTELLNTALESLTDLASPEWRREAKITKDIGAAAMFLVSCGAIIIAGLIFGPHLAETLSY